MFSHDLPLRAQPSERHLLGSIRMKSDSENCIITISFWSAHIRAIEFEFLSHQVGRTNMGIWDAFTGRKATQTATPSSSSTTLQDPAGGVIFDAPTTDDVSAFMTQPNFDPTALHPLAGLNQDTLDYLSLDDSALSDLPGSKSLLPSRGWSDDLCYGTGVTYLTALGIGGTWGLIEGLNRLPPTAPPKLRLNSALNAITRRGPFLGNSAGVVAMMYNGINSTLGYYRGKHDSFNSVAAGGISGMIFKSTRGVRPMLISGSIVASIAGSWAVSYLQNWAHRDAGTDKRTQLTRRLLFER